MTPRGIETGIGALSWQYPDRAVLPRVGSGHVGNSGVYALVHTLGVGWEDALPAEVRGEIVVGHLEPLVTGLALAGGVGPVG